MARAPEADLEAGKLRLGEEDLGERNQVAGHQEIETGQVDYAVDPGVGQGKRPLEALADLCEPCRMRLAESMIWAGSRLES